jgi:hypothetical protein
MSPLRSPRTIAAVLAAAVTGYAYAAVHGAPEPFAAIAGIGTSAVEARGGVVVEVRLADGAPPNDRAIVIDVVTKRLAAAGADVVIEEDRDPRTLRARGAGIGTSGADAIAAGLGVRGALALRPEVDHGADIDALATVQAPGVKVDRDAWNSEADNARHEVPYLSAPDQAALIAAIAHVPIDPANEVVLEDVAATPHEPHHVRTHVVTRRALIDNGDIASAEVVWDPQVNRPEVSVKLSLDGAQRFGEWTAAHVGEKLAIVVDGAVASSPVIIGPIRGGTAVITMGGSDPAEMEAQANALASSLRAGAILPVHVTARVIGTFEASTARTELARVLCALAAALAALAIARGLRRWRALEPAPASVRRGGAIRWGALAPRLAVTLGVPAALWWIGDLAAPGVDRAKLATTFPTPVAAPTIGALGVGAVIVAYVLAELGALAIPAWRARRGAGRDARVPIVAAAAAIATALVIAQAYVAGRAVVFLGGATSPWPVAAALAGGVACAALGAAAIERWGLGNGWSVVIAALVIRAAASALAGGDAAPVALDVGAGALVAIVAIAAARTSVRGPTGAVRLPIAGFAGAALLPAALAIFLAECARIPGADPAAFAVRDRLGQPAAALLAAAALAAVLAVPWSRRAAGARAGAVGASVAIAVGLTAIALLVRDASSAIAILGVALAAAALADVVTEARARARAGWTELAQTADVDHAAELVAGCDRFARGLHVRALGRALTPFAPVIVYQAAPADDA